MPRNLMTTNLEMHASEPLYKQVEMNIVRCLADGEWKPGDRLPTESQLAERFGVAVFTIRAGIRVLVASNILNRKQGIGTFVARHSRQRQRCQFSHIFHNDGVQVIPDRELLSFDKEIASNKVADILGMKIESRPAIYKIGCYFSVDGEPAAALDIMVPVNLFRGLTASAIRNNQDTLYAVYQEACGLNVIRIQERIFATTARAAVADILKMEKNAPVLRIERYAFTYDDTPVEFRVRHIDASKFHYRMDEGGI